MSKSSVSSSPTPVAPCVGHPLLSQGSDLGKGHPEKDGLWPRAEARAPRAAGASLPSAPAQRPPWPALSDLLHLEFIYFNYCLLKASMFQELPGFTALVLRPAQASSCLSLSCSSGSRSAPSPLPGSRPPSLQPQRWGTAFGSRPASLSPCLPFPKMPGIFLVSTLGLWTSRFYGQWLSLIGLITRGRQGYPRWGRDAVTPSLTPREVVLKRGCGIWSGFCGFSF